MVMLTGCSWLPALDNVVPDNREEYRKAETMPALDIPPDLSLARINDDIASKQKSSTYTEFEAQSDPLAEKYGVVTAAKPAIQGDKINPFLSVPGDRASLAWQRVTEFWSKNGLSVARQDKRIGLMDSTPDASGYSYRVRMERGTQTNTSDVYVSGARTDNQQKNTVMLRQLAKYLGVLNQTDLDKVAQQRAATGQSAVVTTGNNHTQLIDNPAGGMMLLVNEEYASTWDKVGRVLDSRGFAVEDRNRGDGIYLVRYIDPLVEHDKPSLLNKLTFWRDDKDTSPDEFYNIKLVSDAAKTRMMILDVKEQIDGSDSATRLLELLKTQLTQ